MELLIYNTLVTNSVYYLHKNGESVNCLKQDYRWSNQIRAVQLNFYVHMKITKSYMVDLAGVRLDR
jgi:hypothetical protein